MDHRALAIAPSASSFDSPPLHHQGQRERQVHHGSRRQGLIHRQTKAQSGAHRRQLRRARRPQKSGQGPRLGHPDTNASAKVGGRKGGRKTAAKKAAKKTTKKAVKQTVNAKKAAKKSSMGARHEQRSAAAKKGWETRRKRAGTKAKVRKTTVRKTSR